MTHPQRCETCKSFIEKADCEVLGGRWLSEQEYNIIVDVGCASHSSAPVPEGYIRPEVMNFAYAMESVLRKHDDKGGWIDAFQTLDQVRSHPYNPQAEGFVLNSSEEIKRVQQAERKEYLGKIALRVRNEFTQDDDEEWYLCANDFESVLDELNQEIEDEAELRQGKDGE